MKHRWTLAMWLAAVAGCGQSDPADVDIAVVSPSEFTESQQAQHDIALAARDALFEKLLERLMETLTSSGPAAAIEVCQQHAPQIATEVSQEYGIDIGRTSHRLRNPENAPPDWAQPLVDLQVAEPTFLALGDGRLGALLPIHLKAQCLMCHGPEDQILPDVQNALSRAYPKDRATDFQEGDLRGWFWVSVPEGAEMPATSQTE